MFKFLIGVIAGIFLLIAFPQVKKVFLDSGVRDGMVETLKEIK